jgi:hypothetical protein
VRTSLRAWVAVASIAGCSWAASACELVVGNGNYSTVDTADDDAGTGSSSGEQCVTVGVLTVCKDGGLGHFGGGSGSSGSSSGGSGSSSGSSGGGEGGGTGTTQLGDSCTADSDCASGSCNTGAFGGWCTATCTSNTDCGTNHLGKANPCVQASNAEACFPGCTADVDCHAFTGTQCFLNLGGPGVGACAAPNGIGDFCSAGGNECAAGLSCGNPTSTNTNAIPEGGQEGWCYEVCSSSSDCGTNAAGVQNFCVIYPTGPNAVCAPGCASDTSICSADFASTTCNSYTSPDTAGSETACGP